MPFLRQTCRQPKPHAGSVSWGPEAELRNHGRRLRGLHPPLSEIESRAIVKALRSLAEVIETKGFPLEPFIVGSQSRGDWSCQFFICLWRTKSEEAKRDTTTVEMEP